MTVTQSVNPESISNALIHFEPVAATFRQDLETKFGELTPLYIDLLKNPCSCSWQNDEVWNSVWGEDVALEDRKFVAVLPSHKELGSYAISILQSTWTSEKIGNLTIISRDPAAFTNL